jgi:hypothetical protein
MKQMHTHTIEREREGGERVEMMKHTKIKKRGKERK